MKIYLFLGVLVSGILNSCNSSVPVRTTEEKKVLHTEEIFIPAEKAAAAGIETLTIQPGEFRNVIISGGSIIPAHRQEMTIVANTSGTISFSRMLAEGIKINTGDMLLNISAAHLQDGAPQQRAAIAYETALKEFERAKEMIKYKIISVKEFETSKEKYENARLSYSALAGKQNGNGIGVASPAAGYVKECFVKEGDYVKTGQPLLSITRYEKLRLRVEVAERYYPQLQSIVSANFKTIYSSKVFSLEEMEGRLISWGHSSENTSHYIPVIFEFKNQAQLLEGSYAEVYLLSKPRKDIISIPFSALVEESGIFSVFVKIDEEHYRRQEVQTGMSDGKHIEILSGLEGGEKIVTRGTYQVRSSIAANTIPGHTHNH